jgi:zinc D-Ala-D-Ala carboxypeptidase
VAWPLEPGIGFAFSSRDLHVGEVRTLHAWTIPFRVWLPMLLTPNFHLEEFTRTATGLPNVPNRAERAALQALATNVLQPLRDSIGKPVYITSGFRSAAVNRAVGGVADSQHRSGQAADIQVEGMSSMALARRIVELQLPFDQLIEEFGEWVHVSHAPQPRRQQLTAVRRAGRTRYLHGLR